jgi:hypothetical protein
MIETIENVVHPHQRFPGLHHIQPAPPSNAPLLPEAAPVKDVEAFK